MSSSREIEHRSASAATFSSTTALLTPTSWRIATDSDAAQFASLLNPDDMADYAAGHDVNVTHDDVKAVKCTALSSRESIRISPMEKTRGGWDDEHFNVNLRVPEGSVVGRGMVIMLEGEFCVLACLLDFV